jgi:Radical SAM superfamily
LADTFRNRIVAHFIDGQNQKGIQMSDIVAIGDHSSARRDVLSVLWAITKVCSFRCSYCVYYKHRRGAEFSSREDLLRAAQTLLRLGRPGYQITLYGGEPTLHPHFEDLLAYFVGADAPVELRMFTNGAQSAGFFDRIVRTTKGFHFLVIFSLHLEFANFSKFKQAVEITAGGGMSVAVNFMFVASHREMARACMEELLELRQRVPFFFGINYPYTSSGEMGTGCTEDDIAWVEASRRAFAAMAMPGHLRNPVFTRIVSSIARQRDGRREELPPEESLRLLEEMHTPLYNGYFCCSGANVMFVEEDGAVRGGVCDKSRFLGNLFTDSEIRIVQNMGVVRCTAAACSSIENIPLPKFRDQSEAEACMVGFRGRAKNYLYRAEAARLEVDGPNGRAGSVSSA